MTTLNLDTGKFDALKTNLCNHFKVQLQTTSLTDAIDLKEEMGNGSIHCVELSDGISLISLNALFKDEFCVNVNTATLNPLYFMYTTNGAIDVHFKKSGKREHLKPFRPMIMSTSKSDSFEMHFKKGQQKRMVILRIDREKYFYKTKFNDNKRKMISARFNNPNPENTFTYTCAPDLLIADVINKNYDRMADDSLQPLLLEGAACLFMGHIIGQYQKESLASPLTANLTESDLVRVQQLAMMIKYNPAADYTIEGLSNLTGLNPFKLQQSFKHLYKRTAADFIRNMRLEHAEGLLKKNQLNVSEVVLAIGLNSNSYFSKIFKQKYNCCPKEYQERIKDSNRTKTALTLAG